MEPTNHLPIAVNRILVTASRAIRDLVVHHYRKLLVCYESEPSALATTTPKIGKKWKTKKLTLRTG